MIVAFCSGFRVHLLSADPTFAFSSCLILSYGDLDNPIWNSNRQCEVMRCTADGDDYTTEYIPAHIPTEVSHEAKPDIFFDNSGAAAKAHEAVKIYPTRSARLPEN